MQRLKARAARLWFEILPQLFDDFSKTFSK